MAGRVRVLADSVRDMTVELRAAREAAPRVDVSKLDGRASEAADRVAAALEAFNRELATTNQHLSNLASRPIVGFLGGGAEAELQRLVGFADRLRDEVAAWRRLVSR